MAVTSKYKQSSHLRLCAIRQTTRQRSGYECADSECSLADKNFTLRQRSAYSEL
jgi:hypothetical protein